MLGTRFFADVAELVDALDLGSSIFDVGVRFPPSVRETGGFSATCFRTDGFTPDLLLFR